MRYNSAFIIFLIMLTCIGCSSTYRVSDFPSKEKFYEDFNDFVKNKSVTVTLMNDSSFFTNKGTMVSGDSLKFSTLQSETEKITLSRISRIVYDYNTYFPDIAAKIILKSGTEITGINVKTLPDSSVQFNSLNNENMPLENIKDVSYKNHWLGVPGKFLMGVVGGAVIGIVIAEAESSKEHQDAGLAVPISAGILGIAGGIWGGIIGYDYIYQFNP